MRTQPSITLSPGVPIRVTVPRSRVFLLLTASAAVDVEIIRSLGQQTRENATGRRAGYGSLPLDPADKSDWFDELVFTSATAQTITYGISNRAPRVEDVASLITVEKSATLVSTADVSSIGTASAQLLLAANANRRAAIITNIGPGIMRVGEAAVTAARGQRLKLDQAATLETTAAIYAIAESSTCKAGLIETRD